MANLIETANYFLGEETSRQTKIPEFLPDGWTVNDDGSIDVDGDVELDFDEYDEFGYHQFDLDKIPYKFGNVTGDFTCKNFKLTSLEGAPKEVEGNFDCTYCGLKSLKGAPEYVGGNFDCSNNSLTSLEGAPRTVYDNFDCSSNEDLQSLEGGPKEVGEFFCEFNNKISPEDVEAYKKEAVRGYNLRKREREFDSMW